MQQPLQKNTVGEIRPQRTGTCLLPLTQPQAMSFGRLMIYNGLPVPRIIRSLNRRSSALLSGCWLVLLFLLAPGASSNSRAQEELPQVDVIAKLLMLEGALGGPLNRTTEEDWVEDYLSLYQNFHRTTDAAALEVKGRPSLALALGIKVSDAILAIKGRSAEGLEASLVQIEELAKKLGIDSQHLSKSDKVRQHTAEAQWHDAFMYFGFLQHELIRQLSRSPQTKGDSVLVLSGIWLQSGRWVTDIILQHYSDPLSESLKEVKMVDLLSRQVAGLPNSMKQDETVKALASLLAEVPSHVFADQSGGIPKKDVQWLHNNFGKLADKLSTNEKSQG